MVEVLTNTIGRNLGYFRIVGAKVVFLKPYGYPSIAMDSQDSKGQLLPSRVGFLESWFRVIGSIHRVLYIARYIVVYTVLTTI